LALIVTLCSTLNAQVKSGTSTQSKKYEYFWINGGTGAGGVVSTNIINSGAVIPFYMEFLLQDRHKRIGLGISHELYLTPENLGKVILGNSANTEKIYLAYEWMLIPNFPINLGVCGNVGGFLVGNDIEERNKRQGDTTYIPNYSYFANVGLVAELGIKPVFFFVKPYIEYKSYGGFHKELLACVTFGLKFKLDAK
jgi:hypothetical protein